MPRLEHVVCLRDRVIGKLLIRLLCYGGGDVDDKAPADCRLTAICEAARVLEKRLLRSF